jgi:hypothetical protein
MCEQEAERMLTVPGRQIVARLNLTGGVNPARAGAFARGLLAAWGKQAIECPRPPPPPGTVTGKVVGRIVGASGDVWLAPGGGSARVRAQINYPLVKGDRLITGENARARIELAAITSLHTLTVGPQTELGVTEVFEAVQDHVPGGFFKLVRGLITWIHPGWTGDSNFSFQSGSTVCGIRGTEFAARYDPATDTAEYYLKSGVIELRNGSQVRQLTQGQSVTIVRNQIGPTQALDPNAWVALAGADPGGAAGANPPIKIRYQGRVFDALYERGNQNGVPIDVYFYRTESMMAPGLPKPQGDEAWSRFVREPAEGSPGPAVWWHVRWDYSARGWTTIQERDVPTPQVIR